MKYTTKQTVRDTVSHNARISFSSMMSALQNNIYSNFGKNMQEKCRGGGGGSAEKILIFAMFEI